MASFELRASSFELRASSFELRASSFRFWLSVVNRAVPLIKLPSLSVRDLTAEVSSPTEGHDMKTERRQKSPSAEGSHTGQPIAAGRKPAHELAAEYAAGTAAIGASAGGLVITARGLSYTTTSSVLMTLFDTK
jgi:hypothetical protein